MRLVSFSTSALPQVRVGLVQGQEVVDVDLAARALNRSPYEQMLDVLEQRDESLPTLRAIVEKAQGRLLSEVRTCANVGAVHDLGAVHLAAPIPRPRKNIMCLGRNYYDHALESYQARGQERPQGDAPVIFTKATTTINEPYATAAMEAGEIPSREPDLMAMGLIGLIVQPATGRLYGRLHGGLLQRRDEITGMCWRGLS